MVETPLVVQTRIYRSNQGTKSLVVAPGYSCKALELPWRDNQRGLSCIPPDIYEVEIKYSQRYKKIYWVLHVPGRDDILIHWGNLAGDIAMGFITHSAGCILYGKYFGFLNGQIAVLLSKPTIRKFMSVMNFDPFRLQIIEAFGGV